MVGANGAWDLLDNKMNLGGNYVYNGANNQLTRDSYSVNYLADGSQIANTSDSFSDSNNNGHRFGIRLEHKFSENTSILFEPQINFGNNHSVSGSNQLRENIVNGVSSKSSEGFTSGASDGKNLSTSGRFLLRQRLGIPGRTLPITASVTALPRALTSPLLPVTFRTVPRRIRSSTSVTTKARKTLLWAAPLRIPSPWATISMWRETIPLPGIALRPSRIRTTAV